MGRTAACGESAQKKARPQTERTCKRPAHLVARSGERLNASLEFALVMGGSVLGDDPLRGEAIQVGLDVVELSPCLLRILRRAEVLDHRTDPAAVDAVARAPLRVLPYPLLSRFVLWHETIDLGKGPNRRYIVYSLG